MTTIACVPCIRVANFNFVASDYALLTVTVAVAIPLAIKVITLYNRITSGGATGEWYESLASIGRLRRPGRVLIVVQAFQRHVSTIFGSGVGLAVLNGTIVRHKIEHGLP